MINNGVKMLKESDCDFIIGIGGGSPLDSAKAIAAMAVNDGSIADFSGKKLQAKFCRLLQFRLPQVQAVRQLNLR